MSELRIWMYWPKRNILKKTFKISNGKLVKLSICEWLLVPLKSILFLKSLSTLGRARWMVNMFLNDMFPTASTLEAPQNCFSLALLHFSPYFTFAPPSFHYDYLIPLPQGHMAIHTAVIMTRFLIDYSLILLLYMTHRDYDS